MHMGPVRTGRSRLRGASTLRLGVWALLAALALAPGCGSGGDGGGSSGSKQGDGNGGAIAPIPTGAHAFVLAPEKIHYGGTYAQWSQRWWQWVYETPRTGHPLYDQTGADFNVNQVDPVWFIGGLLSTWDRPFTGAVTRNITLPRGISLFFPLVNTVVDNTSCNGNDTVWTFSEMRALSAANVEAVENVFCEIDGTTILNARNLTEASRFRAQAPAFSAYRTADNIWIDFCAGLPQVEAIVSPIASDGIWMMVGPMPTGAHTLHFGGTFPTVQFTIDITYHITVEP